MIMKPNHEILNFFVLKMNSILVIDVEYGYNDKTIATPYPTMLG